MKILHVISSVDLKFGGAIEGVNQLSAASMSLGAEVEICSLDAVDADCVLRSSIKVHALGPIDSTYGYSSALIPWLKSHADEYDAVIVNGLWQYTGYAVRKALLGTSTPYFVFTHGMLDPWFKVTYPLKHLKKWVYWLLAEYRVLRDAQNVIFTCEEERLLAKQSFGLYNVKEAVTAFGIEYPPSNHDELARKFIKEFPHLDGKRLILYLSRIHVKKGCDLLIEGFASVAHQDENLHLVIAGPDETGWAAELKKRAESLGVANRITWTGMLLGDMKWGAFNAAEVFCLPSHQENFGIVVAEALACAKPVLISNKVNIWREIEKSNAGFVAPDTLEGTVSNYNRWLQLSSVEFEEMKGRSRECFTDNFHVKRAAERLLEILSEGVKKAL